MRKFVATSVMLLLAAGCTGGSSLPEGETGTVKGTVTYNGQPVPEGSTVMFMKVEGGFLGIGTTDAAGNYTLAMQGAPDILAGQYYVGISPPVADSGLTPEQIMEQGSDALPETPSVIPERYLSAESSGLRKDVAAGENTIDITLTDAE